MNEQVFRLLLCTNGAPEGRPALDYGAWLAGQLDLPITLLGIVEDPGREDVVRQTVDATAADLAAQGLEHTTQVREGRARKVIAAEADPQHHLVVVGPMGRPALRRWLRGRSLRRMMPNLPGPFIYVPTAHRQLARILMSTGALGHAASAERCAVELARYVGAALTILHVVETVHYEYPTAEEITAHWQELLTTETPQASHLRELLEQARAAGVVATLHVRRGDVLHEIIAEARAEPYDLLVMGSKHSSDSLRRQYLPDVTASVMEALSLPVLVVRADGGCPLSLR